ncbi:MAG: molybdenum cofactor guanylyltransferase [Woeseia sp.]
MTRTNYLPAFSYPVDAIVLAGTHRDPKRSVMGKNKAFLEIDGRPLIQHVIDALLGARSISAIYVVGPVDQMTAALGGVPGDVQLVPQEGNMLANCWAGVHASQRRRAPESEQAATMRPYLILSSDLPLISPASLDDFVARCADEDQASNPYGLMTGIVDEAGVQPFFPDGAKPGIARPFVHLEFARVRLANIYIVRPKILAHEEFLQTGFGYRKAVDWKNVVGLAFSILSQKGGLTAAWLTMRLQATLLAARKGGRLYRWLRRGNTRERIERSTSTVLGGPVRLVITPFGGLSLDVDDEADFRVLDSRFADWIAIHDATESRYPLTQMLDRPVQDTGN